LTVVEVYQTNRRVI